MSQHSTTLKKRMIKYSDVWSFQFIENYVFFERKTSSSPHSLLNVHQQTQSVHTVQQFSCSWVSRTQTLPLPSAAPRAPPRPFPCPSHEIWSPLVDTHASRSQTQSPSRRPQSAESWLASPQAWTKVFSCPTRRQRCICHPVEPRCPQAWGYCASVGLTVSRPWRGVQCFRFLEQTVPLCNEQSHPGQRVELFPSTVHVSSVCAWESLCRGSQCSDLEQYRDWWRPQEAPFLLTAITFFTLPEPRS